VQHLLRPEIRQATRSGSYAVAVEIARDELEGLEPAEALERVLAAADADPLLYDAMALWWLFDGIVERRMTLHFLYWSACRFDEVLEFGRRSHAEEALRNAAGRQGLAVWGAPRF
jgi:hypothetical protein